MKFSSLRARFSTGPLRVLLVALNIALAMVIAAVLLVRCGTVDGEPESDGAGSRSQDQVQQSQVSLLPSIRITTTPVNAGIYLNAQYIGEAPLRIAALDPGEYLVEARERGYHTASRRLELEFGQHEKVDLSLELVTGQLRIETIPSGGTVTLNGLEQHPRTPLHLRSLPPGRYQLSIRMSGYLIHESAVFVRDGELTEYSVYLTMNRRKRFGRAVRGFFGGSSSSPQSRQPSTVQQQSSQREAPRLASALARAQESAERRRAGTAVRHEPDASQAPDSPADPRTVLSSRSKPDREAPQASAEDQSSPVYTEERGLATRQVAEDTTSPVPKTPPSAPSASDRSNEITSVDRLDGTKRRPLHAPEPEYPVSARRHGTEGQVEVAFWVERDGRVANIDIISSQPRRMFDRAVLDAVGSWRFENGEKRERLVRTFDFVLEDTGSPNSVPAIGERLEAARPRETVDREPISRVKPDYPQQALRRGIEGVVRYELQVRSDGSVAHVRLLNHDRPRVFDREARRALRQWRFEPGAGSEWTYEGEIDFRLEH